MLFELKFHANLFKSFAPNSECFTKYDAFCSKILECREIEIVLLR